MPWSQVSLGGRANRASLQTVVGANRVWLQTVGAAKRQWSQMPQTPRGLAGLSDAGPRRDYPPGVEPERSPCLPRLPH